MFWHDDYFTLISGETKPIFRISKHRDILVIQHPYFQFGSFDLPYLHRNEKLVSSEYTTPIYHLQYEVASDVNVFDFKNFLRQLEENWYLKKDESLWYETGFWSIEVNEVSFIGMGLQKLIQTLRGEQESRFAICFANNDFILIVSSGKERNQTIFLSIYATNAILPFAEVVEPFKKAVSKFNSKNLLKNEILREEDLKRHWFARHPIHLNPVAYVIDRNIGDDYKRLPIVKNETKTRDSVIGKIEFLTGTTRGGFIEEDYTSKRLYSLRAEIWELQFLSIVCFFFEFD